MANELRVRTNFVGGLIEDNPLASGATTLTSAGLASLPAVTSTSHMAIILDPDGRAGNPEIAYVTAHTALATTATITRAQEGTTGRAHDRDTPWIHGPTVADFPVPVTYTVPANTTVTSTSLASLATPITVAVTVLPGQVVEVEAMIDATNSSDSVPWWGLRRNPSTVLCKGSLYTAGAGQRPSSMTARWIDTAPGSGNVTYELLLGAFSGAMTALVSDGSTTIGLTGTTGGGTQITATPRWS